VYKVDSLLKKLSELKSGEEGVIVRIIGRGSNIRRMLDMGLTSGTKIRVIRKAPLGDPIEFEVRGFNLSLRKEEADLVVVKTSDENFTFSSST